MDRNRVCLALVALDMVESFRWRVVEVYNGQSSRKRVHGRRAAKRVAVSCGWKEE